MFHVKHQCDFTAAGRAIRPAAFHRKFSGAPKATERTGRLVACLQRSAKRRTAKGAVCQWHTSSADRAEGETLERNKGKSPGSTQWGRILPEPQRKRPSALAASQRDDSALTITTNGDERK